MNNINKKLISFFIVIILVSNTSYANDGGQYYWGPEGIYTDTEEKIVKADEIYIKVYKGAGESFQVDEKAIIPNDAVVDVYATITNGDIKWSLIKYLYMENLVGLFDDEDGNRIYDDEKAIEYYNKLSPLKKYEVLVDNYYDYSVRKDFGWVKDKYLISKNKIEGIKQEEAEKVFESIMESIKNKDINNETEEVDNQDVKDDDANVDKKRSIFDIIKSFFGLK